VIRRELMTAAALAVAFLIFTLLVRQATGELTFASGANLELILRQTAIVGTSALGMTLIIAAGGIDLSAGAMIALATVVIATSLTGGRSPLTAAILGILSATLAGALNGILVTRLRVVPFIVTLGTMLGFRGVAKGLAHEQKVDAPMSWLNGALATLGPGERWMIFPAGVWLMIVLAVAVALLLDVTRFGRHLLAVGSNEAAARLAGVRVARVKVTVYLLGGLLTGVAGVMQFARLSVGDPTVATGLELDIIAAVVIGGASLSGGEGSVLGSLLGALIMTVIRAGGSQLGWSSWVQEIVTGVIIVAAVAIDRIRGSSLGRFPARNRQ
jgi:ribose/xylose/arabinose/galactoside ABC-type transport system permease subunit